MVDLPLSSASWETSIIVTANPCCAKTCAMPFPICPAPTTAMRSLTCLRLLAAPEPRAIEIGQHQQHAERRGEAALGSPLAAGEPRGPLVDGAIVGRVEADAAHRRVEGDGEHPVPCDVRRGGCVHTAERDADG